MKKKNVSKLHLNQETLRKLATKELSDKLLAKVAGGASMCPKSCGAILDQG